MKALQIALLVAAGAMAGAVVMKVWQKPPMALQPVAAPPPVVAQAETPSPVAVGPVELPPVASPQQGQPTPGSARAWAPPTHVAVRPPVGDPSERPARRPVYAPTRVFAVPPAESSERAAASRNEPARPATPPPAPGSRSSGAGASLAYPREAAMPASLPETPQEGPTRPPTPPARTEPEKVTSVPPPPSEPHRVTLNAGILIPVRLVEGLSTERNKPGDRFTATLVKELVADDFVIAERGARVEGRVVASGPTNRNAIVGLTVELTRLHTSDGQSVDIRTESFERRPGPLAASGKIEAGSAMSPSIGPGAGGRQGAVIGPGRVSPLRGLPATLPRETRIPFRLGASVTLTERVR